MEKDIKVLAMPFWKWAVIPTTGLAAIDCIGMPFYRERTARQFLAQAQTDVPHTTPILFRRSFLTNKIMRVQ